MGSLPTARVRAAQPFAITGLDFAGPYLLKRKAGRPTRNQPVTMDKAWICVFVCMATRAVHLDLTHGLSTEAFMETFARFISRRGVCNGGIWEAGVKSVKFHLRRVLGAHSLTANKLYTLLTQIEACLNSRPLAPVSQDLSDPQPLTPGHFLIGRPLLQPPLSQDTTDVPYNRLTAWGHQQQLINSFWSRWKDEYLLSMQRRMKWYSPSNNLEVGDIVLILDENTPPTAWLLGKIEEVLPGKDGFVRNVVIKTQTSTLKRPIQKVISFVNHRSDTNNPSGSGFPNLV